MGLSIRTTSRLNMRWQCIVLMQLLFAIWPVAGKTIVHNASFIPDAVLRVTLQNINVGGIRRLTTLVNGSLPGPELRIPEQEVTWIRVYNDMQDQNLTMVCTDVNSILRLLNCILALARSCSGCRPIL